MNKNMIKIPENELSFKFIRSSGPGGQKVNKTATKVQARWNLDNSQILIEEQKNLVRSRLKNLLTKEGDIIIENDETRHQLQNRENAISRLNELVNQALKKKKKRIPTKPSKAAKKRRLEEKRRRSEIKKSRQKIKDY